MSFGIFSIELKEILKFLRFVKFVKTVFLINLMLRHDKSNPISSIENPHSNKHLHLRGHQIF